MDYAECPDCRQTAERMPVLSFISLTDDFYKCDRCGHVSSVSKVAPMAASARFTLAQVQLNEAHS